MDSFHAHSDHGSTVITALAVLAASIFCLSVHMKQSELKRLPTAGYSFPLLSYITAIRFYINSAAVIREGQKKFPNQAFKIANITEWIVVVNGTRLINELKDVSEDELSFMAAVADGIQNDYTFGPANLSNPYHFAVIKIQLARNLASLIPDMIEEMFVTFDQAIPLLNSQWLTLNARDVLTDMVCRINNRVFVGDLCRDAEFRRINIAFTMDVVKDSMIIGMFPTFLKPLAQHLFGNASRASALMTKLITPLVSERQNKIKEHGPNYPDKPLDLLSWLMDDAIPEEMTSENLARRVLSVNFAAVHTTSMSLIHAVYHLAAEPQYIEPLREEVEAVVCEHGWTRNSISKLHKIDSFLRESQRVNTGTLVMNRKAVGKDYVFSDGSVIPVNTVVYASTLVHHEDSTYPNAHIFEGFRFSKIRKTEGSGSLPLTALSPQFLPFGLGTQHACPGRMFGANQLKMMLAYMVLNYDVKMEKEGVRPANLTFGPHCLPDLRAEVMFRKRAED